MLAHLNLNGYASCGASSRNLYGSWNDVTCWNCWKIRVHDLERSLQEKEIEIGFLKEEKPGWASPQVVAATRQALSELREWFRYFVGSDDAPKKFFVIIDEALTRLPFVKTDTEISEEELTHMAKTDAEAAIKWLNSSEGQTAIKQMLKTCAEERKKREEACRVDWETMNRPVTI